MNRLIAILALVVLAACSPAQSTGTSCADAAAHLYRRLTWARSVAGYATNLAQHGSPLLALHYEAKAQYFADQSVDAYKAACEQR